MTTTTPRDGYLGVSHATCKLRAAAAVTNGRATPPNKERPCRWSQRWSDNPPIGTIVFLGNGRAEVYAGNGEWHTMDAAALN